MHSLHVYKCYTTFLYFKKYKKIIKYQEYVKKKRLYIWNIKWIIWNCMFLHFKMLEVDAILSLRSGASDFPQTHGLNTQICFHYQCAHTSSQIIKESLLQMYMQFCFSASIHWTLLKLCEVISSYVFVL